MRDNSKRGTSKLAILGVLSLLALIVGMGAIRTNLAHAATTVTVQVGQTNGGTTSASQFNSASISVAQGDTVRFVRFAGSHNVVSAVSPAGATAMDLPVGAAGAGDAMVAGTNYDRVFTTAGTYTYYCNIHANASDATDANILSGAKMVGKIVVSAPVADTTAPTASGVAASPNPTNGAGGVALSATVGDNIGVTQARYQIDGGASVAMTVSGGTSATATIPTGALTLGLHTVGVQSQDAAGNVSAWTLLVGGLTVSGTPAGGVQATVTVSGGSLSNVAQAIAFPGVTVNGLDQTVAGTTTPAWQAKDARGTGAGWNVTVSSSDFSGSAGSIAVANFKVQLTAVTTVAGNAAPLPTPASYVALSIATPLKLLSAALNAGMGTYDYAPQFQLTVPGSALTGAYAANVTVSVNSGP